jgi:hypothetical protein
MKSQYPKLQNAVEPTYFDVSHFTTLRLLLWGSLTYPTPSIQNLSRNACFGFSGFHILCFREYCDGESRLLIPPTLGIRSYIVLLRFQHFTFCDSGTHVVKCFDTSTSQYPRLRNGVGSICPWSFLPTYFPKNDQAHSCTLHAPLHLFSWAYVVHVLPSLHTLIFPSMIGTHVCKHVNIHSLSFYAMILLSWLHRPCYQ